MYEILKLNSISNLIYNNFDENYNVTDNAENPDAILVRSANMLEYPIKDKLIAVARAGAGVNNIPLPAMTESGVCVFNTPGANANAVKELVICALFLAARKVSEGIVWASSLKGSEGVAKQVESGKKAFAGGEILGKKLGIIGFGAIGKKVAQAATALGMKVYAYDALISGADISKADTSVIGVDSLDEIYAECDYITLHLPLLPTTKDMINQETISKMKKGVAIINCARGELVNVPAIAKALEDGTVKAYVTDFPNDEIVKCDRAICIPHLGASTLESEDNCALMASKELVDYITKGCTINSVNLANVCKPQTLAHRVTVITKQEIDSFLQGFDFVSKQRNGYYYTIIDCDSTQNVLAQLKEVAAVKIRIVY